MKFYTNFLVNLSVEEYINQLEFNNIKLSCINEPTGKHFQGTDNRSFITNSQRQKRSNQNEVPLKLLIIEAKSKEVAEDFISILFSSCYIQSPGLFLSDLFNQITEITKLFYDKKFIDIIKPNFNQFPHLQQALEITKRTIDNNELVYALEKFKLSRIIYSLDIHSAHPKYGDLFKSVFIQRSTHTEQAFAIISAFSVIEELGLEVRSSSKNVRFINNATGEWNPVVLKDVQQRLKDANVDEDDTIDWIFRGNKSSIEEEIKPYFGKDSIWCEYDNVRDKTLFFPEAIHNASYLRNFIASHKFNKMTKFLNPYDVLNVQNLARQLLLRKIGILK